MVTIYKSMRDNTPHHVTIETTLKRIKDGNSKEKIEAIRSGKGDKTQLPAVIYAGVVKGNTRKDEDVVEHSGVFVIDFDHVDVDNKKSQLKRDPYIYACWTSPSGDGVKALVRIPPSLEKHPQYYDSFIERYPELDTTSRNIGRLCFESYDPNLFYNPNSLVWDKTLTKENRQVVKSTKERRNNRVVSIAVDMIRGSVDGEKHDSILRAGNLIGGYLASGSLDSTAIDICHQEINAKPNIKDVKAAISTFDDGIENGKRRPLHEAKKIEKSREFVKRGDGSYDFLADKQEMDDYEQAVIDGTLEMGLPTGYTAFDKYFMFKRNHLVFWGGLDNVGKSYGLWYFAVLAALYHDWKFLIFSAENSDGLVRRKIKEFVANRPLKEMYERKEPVDDYVDSHFKIMTSRKGYTWDDMILRAEIVFDEGFEFDCLVAEPYNAMYVPKDMNFYSHDVYALNRMREFKQNYSSIWVADHIESKSAREKDDDGYVKVPWKSSMSGGQIKSNKADDIIMMHRLANHPDYWNVLEFHTQKIKETETGGKQSPKDDPFKLMINQNMCGYHTEFGVDAVEEYWKKLERHNNNRNVDSEQKEESAGIMPSEDFDDVPF